MDFYMLSWINYKTYCLFLSALDMLSHLILLTHGDTPKCKQLLKLLHSVLSYNANAVSFPIPRWPLPAVRDLTRDGRWSTYDVTVSVLKLSNVSFRGKCARMGNTLKIHHQQNSHGWVIFLQLARRAALPAWCFMYTVCLFSEFPQKSPRYSYSSF